MAHLPIDMNPDIRCARTLPSWVYHDPNAFQRIIDQIFAPAWHCLGLSSDLIGPGIVRPFYLLPGALGEPLLLTQDKTGQAFCLSNVCTHRGNLLAERTAPCHELRCRYHGRRFGLDGQMKSMPEFEGVEDFPGPADHLPQLPLEQMGPLLFTRLETSESFALWMKPVLDRVGFLELDKLEHLAGRGQSYDIEANWALYVDNYLEGFHIPFVHPGLNAQLSYPDYGYELFEQGSLQLGIGKSGEATFDLPENHPDAGKNVSAYYFWLFPNLMLNFYPWGLSLNIVEPVSSQKTRVRFESFAFDVDGFDPAWQADLHQTEMEDEAVVQTVQKGVRSRLYDQGRYSPKMEPAVHHFHCLFADAWNDAEEMKESPKESKEEKESSS